MRKRKLKKKIHACGRVAEAPGDYNNPDDDDERCPWAS